MPKCPYEPKPGEPCLARKCARPQWTVNHKTHVCEPPPPTPEQVARALRLAIRALWLEWKPGRYCEVKGCKVAGATAPYLCGQSDAKCRAAIEAEFLRRAKA